MKTPELHTKQNMFHDKPGGSMLKKYASVLLLLTLLCFAHASFAQIDFCAEQTTGAVTCSPTPGAFPRITLPDATEGQDYSYVFRTNPASGITLQSSPLGAGLDGASGLTLSIDAGALKISGAGSGLHAGTYDFTVHIEAPGGSDDQDFEIIINRRPVDIALVLDKSGSMSLNSGSSSVTRWNALKSAVGLFMTNLQMAAHADDKIGLSFFDGAVVQPPTGFPTPLIPALGSSSAVTGNFSGGSAVNPGGSTAFGAGLQDGLSKIPYNANRKRFIMVFTDGEQNVPNTSFVNIGAGNHVYLGASPFTSDPVKIYPIGIGAQGSLPAILTDIANSAEGNAQGQINTEDGTDMSGNYGSLFLNALSNILKDGSPQIVDSKRGKFNTPVGAPNTAVANYMQYESRDSFVVNKRIRKFAFNVMSNTTRGFNIVSVKKNGFEFIQNGRIDTGMGYRVFTLSLDQEGLYNIPSEGTWTITTRSYLQDSYEVTLVVDDHVTHYHLGAGTGRMKVGMPINLTADASYGGHPVKNAAVQAIILKPGDDLGELLATTPFNGKPDSSSSDPTSIATQKYLALIKDSAFLQKLLAKQQLVTLNYNAADSSYKGQFTNTDVSGVYQVIFKLSVPNDSIHGQIERYQKSSVYVYFPDVDLGKSNVSVSPPTNGVFTISITPVGSNNKHIGPGWGNTIKLDSSTAQIQQVIDNGDGSYSITVKGDPNAVGKISLGGEVIYTGVLGDIVKAGSGSSGEIWKLWWFWLLILLAIILLILLLRRKKH